MGNDGLILILFFRIALVGVIIISCCFVCNGLVSGLLSRDCESLQLAVVIVMTIKINEYIHFFMFKKRKRGFPLFHPPYSVCSLAPPWPVFGILVAFI